MESGNEYLSISEFAEKSGINRRTLIFYDNIGLFTPDYVGENGYRFYKHRQIFTSSIIVTLKELGMPIKEIKTYLQNQEPEQAIKLFEKQGQIITKKINKLRSTQEMIKTRLSLMQKGCSISKNKIEIVHQKEIPIFISSPLKLKEGIIPDEAWKQFDQECEVLNIPFGYPGGFIVNQTELMNGLPPVISNIFIRLGNSKHSTEVIPAGKYVTGYIHGDYNDANKLFLILMNYIQDNNLHMSGTAYGQFLLDEVTTSNPDEFLMQAAICVT